MTPVFADTYYWLALINPRDQACQEAVTRSQALTQPIVTTTWVLTEVGDAMSDPAIRPGANPTAKIKTPLGESSAGICFCNAPAHVVRQPPPP